MITVQDLEAQGFRHDDAYVEGRGPYRKWIVSRADGRKLFRLDVWTLVQLGELKVTAEARLYYQTVGLAGLSPLSSPEHTTFRLDLTVGDGAKVKDIETFFTEAYVRLGCVPDLNRF